MTFPSNSLTNGDWCHEVDGLGMHLGGQELANRISGIAILNGAARWDSNPDLRFWRPLFYH